VMTLAKVGSLREKGRRVRAKREKTVVFRFETIAHRVEITRKEKVRNQNARAPLLLQKVGDHCMHQTGEKKWVGYFNAHNEELNNRREKQTQILNLREVEKA